MIHKCEITAGYGTRIRILAHRADGDAPVADWDVLVLAHGPIVGGLASLNMHYPAFPRGRGIDALFAMILADISADRQRCEDEKGQFIEVPAPSTVDLMREADLLRLKASRLELAAMAASRLRSTR